MIQKLFTHSSHLSLHLRMVRLGFFCYNFFLPPYTMAPGFEPTLVELHQSRIFRRTLCRLSYSATEWCQNLIRACFQTETLIQKSILDELEFRKSKLKERLTSLRAESEEIWKSMETAERSLNDIVAATDFDTTRWVACLAFLWDKFLQPWFAFLKLPFELSKIRKMLVVP